MICANLLVSRSANGLAGLSSKLEYYLDNAPLEGEFLFLHSREKVRLQRALPNEIADGHLVARAVTAKL